MYMYEKLTKLRASPPYKIEEAKNEKAQGATKEALASERPCHNMR